MNFIYTEVPQTSPKSLSVSWTSISTAVVSWTKLTIVEARGFIIHYTVVYYTLSVKRELESNTIHKMVDNNLNSTIISGLGGKTDYIVRVSASTIAGEGNYSKFVLLTSNIAGKLINVFPPFLIINMILFRCKKFYFGDNCGNRSCSSYCYLSHASIQLYSNFILC